MKITWETLGKLIQLMNDDQKKSDVTIEIPTDSGSECYSGELRIAGEDHDGGLDDNHPILYVHMTEEDHERISDVYAVAKNIGLIDHPDWKIIIPEKNVLGQYIWHYVKRNEHNEKVLLPLGWRISGRDETKLEANIMSGAVAKAMNLGYILQDTE